MPARHFRVQVPGSCNWRPSRRAAGEADSTGAQVKGQWQTLRYLMPINPIRLGLLHTGQIVIVAGSENNPTEHAAGTSVGALWDPKGSDD